MVFEPLKQWKWPSIITLVDYPNQNPPTDSADEAEIGMQERGYFHGRSLLPNAIFPSQAEKNSSR